MIGRRIFVHRSVMAAASVTMAPMKDMFGGRIIGRGQPTISKIQADYRPEANDGHRCAECCMFVPGTPSYCTMIEGRISSHGWCKYWQGGLADTCS